MIHYTNTGNPIDFPKLSTIDKLWGKALDRVVPDTYSSLSLTQVEKVKTVFAELIVKECLSFCEYEGDRFDEYDSGMGERARIIRESIHVHFGVEQ